MQGLSFSAAFTSAHQMSAIAIRWCVSVVHDVASVFLPEASLAWWFFSLAMKPLFPFHISKIWKYLQQNDFCKDGHTCGSHGVFGPWSKLTLKPWSGNFAAAVGQQLCKYSVNRVQSWFDTHRHIDARTHNHKSAAVFQGTSSQSSLAQDVSNTVTNKNTVELLEELLWPHTIHIFTWSQSREVTFMLFTSNERADALKAFCFHDWFLLLYVVFMLGKPCNEVLLQLSLGCSVIFMI